MSLADVQLHLVDSVDEASELMRWLSTVKGPLAVDTETTGLSRQTDHVRLVQVGDDVHGWAMDFHRWGGVFEEVIRKWRGDFVGHNSPFDHAMLAKERIKIDQSRFHDTRPMVHILEPHESTALKYACARHVDARAVVMMNELDDWVGKQGKWSWADVPIVSEGDAAIYWHYGALDPVLTRRVYDVVQPRVAAEAPLAYEIERGVAWVTEAMELRGCRIDRDFTARCSEAFLEYIRSAQQWCQSSYGVDPGKHQLVIARLQQDGVEFTKRTASGNGFALDKEVLELIEHPLAEVVLNRRRVEKLQSTYLRRFLEYSEYDGFLHPNINTIGGSSKSIGESGGTFGVRTGRMSMDHVNFQQLPRVGTSEWADVVRNCVIARPGNILIMCDFDQIEMRLLAHLSQDPGLRAAFQSDLDFFVYLARQIYSDPSFEKSDRRRQVVKNSGYAKIYGAGVGQFAATARIDTQTAIAFLQRFDALYPGVIRFQQGIDDRARARLRAEGQAYVRSTFTGRKYVAKSRKEYALVNYLIQGMAAELLKMKILELDAAGLGEYMILPVHDEVILDVPVEHAEWVIGQLRQVMNDSKLLSVPVTASVATGPRWGEKTELEVAA